MAVYFYKTIAAILALVRLSVCDEIWDLQSNSNGIVSTGNLSTRAQRQIGGGYRCDFDCVHGVCNPTTRSCDCNEGWDGAACDVCVIERLCDWSISRPTLAIILPQTGPALYQNDSTPYENAAVFAHGRGFPKSRDSRYNCLFGGVATEGRWLSNTVVRCNRPPRAHVGKHAFNLVPLGSNIFVPYEAGTVHHFTFYANCDASSCQNHCLGPLCLCRLRSQSGQRCEISNLETTIKSVVLENDTTITHALELRPYIASIPVTSESTRLTIMQSDIPELEMDVFDHMLYWQQPIGRAHPYTISVEMDDLNSRTMLNWSLTVEPTYIPVVANVSTPLSKGNNSVSNAHIISGYIEFENVTNSGNTSKQAPLFAVPVNLRIFEGSGDHLLETVRIDSMENEPDTFVWELFPYANSEGRYSITADHPGRAETTEVHFVEWLDPQFQVHTLNSQLELDGPNFTATYQLSLDDNSSACHSTKWKIEVLEPRNRVFVVAVNHSQIQELIISYTLPLSTSTPFMPNLPLRTIFNCGHRTTSTTQKLTPSRLPTSVVKLTPDRLFITTNQSPPSLTVSVDIKLEYLKDGIDAHSLSYANFSPFRLVWGRLSNIENLENTIRLWLALDTEWDNSLGSADGRIEIPNSQNPILSIPYRIRRQPIEKVTFTLTLKCFGDPSEGGHNSNSLVDVELYNTNKVQFFTQPAHLNVPITFVGLTSDYFQLTVKSTEFAMFTTVIKITADNNTFTLGLVRQSSHHFVSDGWNIAEENATVTEVNQLEPPRVSIRPSSVFAIGNESAEFFANFVYETGPPGSFAEIHPVTEAEQYSPFSVTLNKEAPVPPLCVGCGYRLLVRAEKKSLESGKHNGQCNAYYIKFPFLYTVPGIAVTFRSEATAIVDTRSDGTKPVLCRSSESDITPLAEKTHLVMDCGRAKLKECRKLLYLSQRATTSECDSQWNAIPDDLLSIHTYAQFLLLAAKCRMVGVDFEAVQQLLSCVLTMDFDCPSTMPSAPQRPLIDPSLFKGQLFNEQISSAGPLMLGVRSMFPALSAVDAQLASFPAVLKDFLEQLESSFPASELDAILSNDQTPRDSEWFDKFIELIADSSSGGAVITEEELSSFIDWRNGETLVQGWNETYQDLQGDDPNLQYPRLKKRISRLKELVHRADRLKSITRQFGGENPFAMLHEVLQKMFANLKDANSHKEKPLGSAVVRIDPATITEGEEFRVFVTIQNTMAKQELRNIRLNLDFGRESFGPNANGMKYRLGPVFYSGISSLDSDNRLNPKATISIEWTVVAVPDFRLTRTIIQTPQIVLSFESAGQRKIQRLRSPAFRITPSPSIRLLAFAFPTIHQDSSQRPFSISLSVINSGYADLNKVEIIDINPWVVVPKNHSSLAAVNYKIDGIQLDGDQLDEQKGLDIGSIVSGKLRIMTLNISTIREHEAIFRNLSLTTLVDGFIPARYEYRFFLIHDIVQNQYDKFLVSESTQPFPLHYYNRETGKLIPLQNVQPLESKEIIQEINGYPYLSVVVAFRRLATNAINSLPISTKSAIFGTVKLNPDKWKRAGSGRDDFELVSVTEVLAKNGSPQRRLVEENRFWTENIDGQGNTTTIKFIDLEASGSSSQLFYELRFGNPEHFAQPYFPQDIYRVQLMSSRWRNMSGPLVVSPALNAVSPVDSTMTYNLFGHAEDSSFQVSPKTGEVILLDPKRDIPNEDLCMNLEAQDVAGRKTIVPIEFTASKVQEDCSVFGADVPVFSHTFQGDIESLVRSIAPIIPEEQITGTVPPHTTQIPVSGEDATLQPITRATVTAASAAPTRSTLSHTTALVTETETHAEVTVLPTVPEAEEEETISHPHLIQTTTPARTARPRTVTTFPMPQLPWLIGTTTRTSLVNSARPTTPIIGPQTGGLSQLPHRSTETSTVATTSAQPTQTPYILHTTMPDNEIPTLIPSLPLPNESDQFTTSETPIKMGIATPGLTKTTHERRTETELLADQQEMVQRACDQRRDQPIWAVICDLAKTVYRQAHQRT
ncbi:EGF-like domain containing protein [Ditylenchus destructor]|nr:EGF-like domain containing protein [Ditylenchus destructor]